MTDTKSVTGAGMLPVKLSSNSLNSFPGQLCLKQGLKGSDLKLRIVQLDIGQSLTSKSLSTTITHHHHTNFLKGSRPTRRLRFDMKAYLRLIK